MFSACWQGEDIHVKSQNDFPTVSQPWLATLGTCLIYSGSFVGLDLECQLEQPYSLDISSQLAEQWPNLVGQCKDKISSMSCFFVSVLIY